MVDVLEATTFILGEVDRPEAKVFAIGKDVDYFRNVSYEDLFANDLDVLKAQVSAILAKLPK